jgi:hypothetical protein
MIKERYPDMAIQSLRWQTVALDSGETLMLSGHPFAVAGRIGDDGQLDADSLQVIDDAWTAPNGHWRAYRFGFYSEREPEGLALNFLDRRVGQAWIEVEHERYAEHVGEYMGNTMPGAFIDLEGDYGTRLAYSDDLAAHYRKRTGRDLRLWLPLLIDEDSAGVWRAARWEWFKTVSEVYIDALIRPLDQWFARRDMFMTCHFWEENLVAQAMRTGDYFAAQRAYSLPGTDSLFMSAVRPRDFKETQAVSEFEGRQFLCELLGVAGWHVSPTDLRNATNHAIAWGVTQIVPHGIGSNRNLRSVSYPPDFFDWNPYWSHFELYTDYTRRASYVNAQGRLAADTLLLCPMDSVWSLLGDALFDADVPYKTFTVDQRTGLGDPEATENARHGDQINAIERAYSAAMSELSANYIEYLPIDAEYLRQIAIEGAALKREGYEFRTVVLPPLAMLPLDAAEKLAEFAVNGGPIVTLGDLPAASVEHGGNCPRMAALSRKIATSSNTVAAPHGIASLIASGTDALNPQVSFTEGAFPLIQQHRRIDGRDFFWLANATPEKQTATLRLNAPIGPLLRWDCETGARRPVAGTGDAFAWTFEPYEAFWLECGAILHETARESERTGSKTLLGPLWRVSFDESRQPDPAQHKQTVPAWMRGAGETRALGSWLDWGLRSFTGFLDYETEFDLQRVPDSLFLDLGTVKHIAEVYVNGTFVGARLWTPYRLDISAAARAGVNTLKVRIGNLLLNAVTQYEAYDWKWYSPPTDEELDSGLLGPVALEVETPSP